MFSVSQLQPIAFDPSLLLASSLPPPPPTLLSSSQITSAQKKNERQNYFQISFIEGATLSKALLRNQTGANGFQTS